MFSHASYISRMSLTKFNKINSSKSYVSQKSKNRNVEIIIYNNYKKKVNARLDKKTSEEFNIRREYNKVIYYRPSYSMCLRTPVQTSPGPQR